MSLQDDVTAVKRCLDELVRSVDRLEKDLAAEKRGGQRTGEKPEAAPGRPEELVTIPDTPYDASLWRDSDDEGLGSRDRHAP
ncbi:hypothetical protein [Streptomyces sp. TRM64462]|uniref:hypothetical protein n=1 Tax=Streptomyces sp. TRM64462 TaxID=2741726 RepID=UPI001585E0B6|nr:hypothetical protein [Streptomyces sp. TRM64462]